MRAISAVCMLWVIGSALISGCGAQRPAGAATPDAVLGSFVRAAHGGDRDGIAALVVPGLADHARERAIDGVVGRYGELDASVPRVTSLNRSGDGTAVGVVEGRLESGRPFREDVLLVEMSDRWYWLPED